MSKLSHKTLLSITPIAQGEHLNVSISLNLQTM